MANPGPQGTDMKARYALKLGFLLWALWLLPIVVTSGRAEDPNGMTPREILDRVDDLFRGKSSRGEMTMAIATAHWTRTLSLEFWSEGKDKSLIRILAPKKEQGTATLRVGNDIWNFLPKVKRVIKLPSSMMSASWMGSHFTNDDLVKESRMTEDYTFEVTHQGEREGREIVEVTCLPKPDAPVVWGKVIVTVRTKDYLPLTSRYYDEDMKLARTMTFSDIGPLGGRTLPKRMTVIPADKPDEKTEVTYTEITFDPVLPAETFSLRYLLK
jgi:outer membrane lipoprotein-sorting protein